MDFIFAAKFKLLFIILMSVGVFAYFKYIKKSHLPSKYALMIGLFFLTIGWASVGSFYSINTMVETLLLKSKIPFMMEKMFLVGYSFILMGLMLFVDEILGKVFKEKKSDA